MRYAALFATLTLKGALHAMSKDHEPPRLPLTPVVRAPVGENRLQAIATEIARQYRKTAKEIIATAVLLRKRKEEVAHGEFERLFQDHPRHVKNRRERTMRYGRVRVLGLAVSLVGCTSVAELRQQAPDVTLTHAQPPAATIDCLQDALDRSWDTVTRSAPIGPPYLVADIAAEPEGAGSRVVVRRGPSAPSTARFAQYLTTALAACAGRPGA